MIITERFNDIGLKLLDILDLKEKKIRSVNIFIEAGNPIIITTQEYAQDTDLIAMQAIGAEFESWGKVKLVERKYELEVDNEPSD